MFQTKSDVAAAQTKVSTDLVERVRSFAPKLEERAATTESLRRLPDETIEDFRRAGLLRLTTPRKFGGHELGLDTMFEVIPEIARYCASSAWVGCILASSGWWMAHFPESVQQEFWEGNPDATVAGAFAAKGSAVAADGGYKITGHYAFASGILHATWGVLGGMIFDEETQQPDFGIFLVAKKDLKILDDWNSSGLRGTGSNTLVAEDLFVPRSHVLPFRYLREGTGPGGKLYEGHLYRSPFAAATPISMVPLGIAQGALRRWVDFNRGRMDITYRQVAERSPSQIQLAESSVEIDCAELLLRRNISETIQSIREGRSMPPDERGRHMRDTCYSANLCVRAVERLIRASGASLVAEGNPIQRAWRDIQAGASHISFRWPNVAEHYGKIGFGLPHGNPFFY